MVLKLILNRFKGVKGLAPLEDLLFGKKLNLGRLNSFLPIKKIDPCFGRPLLFFYRLLSAKNILKFYLLAPNKMCNNGYCYVLTNRKKRLWQDKNIPLEILF